MTNRIDALLKEMNQHNLDSMLITSKANFYYISNYYTEPHERIIAVYVSTALDPLIIIPAMEIEDAKAAGWEYEILSYHDHEDPWQLFRDFLKKNEKIPQSLGLEHDHITLERFEAITRILPNTTISDAQELLADLRVIKNNKEYTLLKQAAELADFGVETGIKAIREGIGELEVIAAIEYELKKQGIQEMSFTTMTLSGAKTASPHGTPSMKKITAGEMVLFDLGVIFEGYCSDITRTVAYKSISDEQKNIYNTVLVAEQKAFEASQIGTPVGKIDLAARNHIEQAGYGAYFSHRIGHGLGVQTHEYPSMHSNNELPLKAGMCYTIEPGIYVPTTGGVRIEDMIFMTEKGPETLTKYPKELQIIE
ncbi:peptidase M24 family protein [Virgibacillus profundi]|uniref:Peptidase M24 family protein n=1 Tax=Virgibacillus profundi TaxID=2024555 RepID=A0A2A2IED6_9BACI|nr:Xaa-Pro peptidase family protein [Virgibacillus profundi]PAV30381.1 peptidase M24 family protein [Virgibacillus profundi]PXY54553.1 aminopeptidase P family protein [Virgibacillus profundi]